MKKVNETNPPRLAERFLLWYCKEEVAEDLQGDLHETFQRHCKSKGIFRARLIYWIDVIKFIRPYTISKPNFVHALIQWIMIASYIKTSGRNLVRNKLFSAINIVGLAISMSVGLLMIAMLNDLFSYDTFHENHERIFRIASQYEYLGKKDNDPYSTTSYKAAKAIKETFTGVEDVAILQRGFSRDFNYNEKVIPLNGLLSNESFFNVFSFELLSGNPATALKEPYSIVLPEGSAKKLFGNAEALGKVLKLNDEEQAYTVTGVLKDPPIFTHIKFEVLASISTQEILKKDDKHYLSWDNIWNTWTYVLMPERADLTAFQKNLDKLSEQEDKTVEHTHIAMFTLPLTEIMIGENMNNQIKPIVGKTVISILAALSFVVVLSACFNYTNLSIARSFRRSREVGIRKTVGALKGNIVMQFIVESVVISFIALIISVGLFLLIKPHFIGMESSLQETLALDLSPRLIMLFLFFAILVGMIAGFFPSVFFARINAIQILKSLPSVPLLKGITLRKVLIVTQYTLSIIAITATLIIYKQYKHFIHYDLGFNTENILNINLQGNKAAVLTKELEELPEVNNISQSLLVTSVGNYWGTRMKNPNDPNDSSGVYYTAVDENYLPLHEHHLLAGRNFSVHGDSAVEHEVIVNEATLKRFDIGDGVPARAIDQIVKIDNKGLRIIGVVKDFEYGRADNDLKKEFVMRYNAKHEGYLNLKINSSDWPSTYAKIESSWKKIDPIHPLDAKFYDDEIQEAFSGLKASIKVGGFLSFLVICIASIGLLGMVVFTIQTRIREISIRKVLGASESGLLVLLSRGFLLLLFIAASIAIPATYLFFENVLLPSMNNHAPIEMKEIFLGFLAVMTIALLMISSQALKAARTNPAEVLKSE